MWQVEPRADFTLGTSSPSAALGWAAAHHGSRPALALPDGAMSFKDIDESARSLAGGLARQGVGVGSRVALWMGNGPDWVTLFFALSRLGAVVIPLNTRLTADELTEVIQRASPQLLICDPDQFGGDHWPMLTDVIGRVNHRPAAAGLSVFSAGSLVSGVRALSELRAPVRDSEEPQSHEAAMILFTSGSTSSPKGVVLRSGAIVRNAFNTGQHLGFRETDVMFSPMPFFHAGGSVLSLLSAVTHGTCLVTMDAFDPRRAVDLIDEHRCTIHIGMDVMYLKETQASNFTPARVASLRTGWIAGTGDGPMRVFRDRKSVV